jgi:uncharacterized membrane protein
MEMVYLLTGLALFLGVHSVRIFANDWRTQCRQRWGAKVWRGAYAALSLIGFTLIVWGFGQVRQNPVQVWSPPIGLRHAASLLTFLAFVLLAAAYVPGNQIKARVHHPMAAAVKLWAFAHLLANGNVGHLVLFGAFLVWAVLSFVAAARRDRLEAAHYPLGQSGATGITVLLGLAGWLAFTLWLHGWLIGVRPFG